MSRTSHAWVIAGALLLASCADPFMAPQPLPLIPQPPLQVAIPNSNNCLMRGGTPRVEYRVDGTHFDVCAFPDGRQCEDWAMSYGDCPVGGVDITPYRTRAARYCAISGGQYSEGPPIKAGDSGSCTFRNGKVCDAIGFWNGRCSKFAG